MKITDVTLFVQSDIAFEGYTEDGDAIAVEWFYVVAEDTKGHRLAHYATSQDNEAVECLQQLLEEAAGDLEMALWSTIDPRYGSDAYLEMEPQIVEREIAEAYAY